MKKTLRLAGIGAFGHYPGVLHELAQLPEVELLGWAPGMDGESPDVWLGSKLNRGRATLYDTPAALLGQCAPDLVVVSTRLDQIAPLAIAAVEAGAALICEKPLALDRPSLERLHDAAQQNSVPVRAMYAMRTMPVLRAARTAVRQGEIGDVILVQAWKSYKWGSARPVWFKRRDQYGGTILWVGIHALDMIRFVGGKAFTRVAGMHSNLGRPDWGECEDHAVLMLELEGGAHASAQLDYYRPEAAPEHGDEGLRVVGTQGVLYADVRRGECRVHRSGDKTPELLPLPSPSTLYRSFAETLLGRATTECLNTRETFQLADTAILARDAADTGKIIEVDPQRWTDTEKPTVIDSP